VTAADGKAVSRARVTLSSALLARSRVVVSDDEGRFAFADVGPGEYELVVIRTGYAPVPEGQSRGVSLRLAAGQQASGVVLRLQPEGVIPGRLYDEGGSPLAGAEVEALSLRAQGGRQSLAPVAAARTDDKGEFRIAGLSAGQYYVVARDMAFSKAGDATGVQRYPATFYPGGISAATARPISVTAGQEAARIEFRVTLVRPAGISGVLRTPDKRPLTSGAVILVPRDGSILDTLPAEDVEITPDGRFTFRNVPPGAYQLRARASVDAKQAALFGSFAVQVSPGRSVEGIAVSLVPGAAIQGRVEWTGGKAPVDLRTLRVRAPFADDTAFGDSLSGTVGSDGSFRIRGVMTGRHYLTVEGLPPGSAVVGILVRGRDMLLQPIDVHETEQVNNVRIVLSSVVTDVSGVVRDPKGRPAADALVLAIPPGAPAWSGVDARFRATRADADGRYRISGLPPGTYRIAALSGSDELAAWRPDWFRRVEPHALAVTLGAADRKTLDLVAVPADAVMPSTSR
jgi:protocatechuate 3,4-dioxygenase beta subunit